jgi:rfaE bifunctional protein kinase chain/domain
MTASEILSGMSKLRALVVGDICLDVWCTYDPALADISRETGIPRVAVISSEKTPGAAGTVANNLAALGLAEVAVLGVIGGDGFGSELEHALRKRGVECGLLLREGDIPTFTYTKLINRETGCEDLPRVDFVYAQPIPPDVERDLIESLERAAPDYDVILVSDQAETAHGGVITANVREALTRVARANPQTVIWADSRLRAEHFRGVILKVNQQEAEAASVRALGCIDYGALRRFIEAPLLIVTHGGDGALVIDDRAEYWVPARRIEHPVDICGAGDSFSAAAAPALKVTVDAVEAAKFGNLAASITIMKRGTGTASPEEILALCGP